MPISFSAAERLAITRRMLKILDENQAFASTQGAFAAEQAKLLQVDVGNSKFHDHYNTQATQYEVEVRNINGTIPAAYTPSDVTTSGETPVNTIFFPSSPTYEFVIPKVCNETKGYFHPIGTDARRELNILSNANIEQGIAESINLLKNGYSGGGASTTTTAIMPGGTQSGYNLAVTSESGFSAGQYVLIKDATKSGLYKVAATAALQITVDSAIPSASSISIGATVANFWSGFSNAQRQTMIDATRQEYFTNLASVITALISEWEAKIDNQITALGLQNDDRSTQASQNTTAASDASNTKSIIDTWQGKGYTGADGQFVDTNINSIDTERSARQSFTATRISQIITALGNSSSDALTQSGNTYSTTVTGNSYHQRYKWLDIKINKATGSLRRYYAAGQGSDALTLQLNGNSNVLNEYNSYFLTKKIMALDGSTTINVSDVTGLSNGNSVTIVSETQPEISRTILQVIGTNQLLLNSTVPTTYLVSDMVRVFKTL